MIVGGGVIGLSIAYRLAQEGVNATLIERGEVGRGASWAGAGMIPANTERLRTSPSLDLRSWSATLYPGWSAALREETGIDNGFRRTGGVDVGWSVEEDQELRSMAGRWKGEGIVYERLAEGDFRRVEPALSGDLRVVYFLPDRAQIRNPWHLRALEAAVIKRGGRIRTGETVLGFETVGGEVKGVKLASGPLSCGTLILAAGAWTGGLVEGLGVLAPTTPLKGQIVLLKCERPLLRRIVEHGKNYLVPREDGRVLVGATEEEAGFDVRSTPEGVRGLIDEALRLCPGLAGAEVEKFWAGLRPGSLDSRPYLGALPGYGNVFVAAGHKRAGLQLSTGTAEVMTDLVLGRPARMDLTPFRVGREAMRGDEEAFRS